MYPFRALIAVLLISCSKSEEANSTKVVEVDKKDDSAVPTSVNSRFFDLSGIINGLFPGFNQGNQGTPAENPPGMNFPSNSQIYPDNNNNQLINPVINTNPGLSWPVIDDASQFPNSARPNTQPYLNQGNFGRYPQTQYPNQGNFGGAPQMQNQYPNQGNFAGSFPSQGIQFPNQGNIRGPQQSFLNGRQPNQNNFGGQPFQAGRFPNQNGISNSFPSQGNFGSPMTNPQQRFPNAGNIVGNPNSQLPNQGNSFNGQNNFNNQYPNQGIFTNQPISNPGFPINSGNPLLNQRPINQGVPNQGQNNFRPGNQISDGTLDSLVPPESSWNNMQSTASPPGNQAPDPVDITYPEISTGSSNAILGNPVIVPSTTTERGRINYPTSTETAAIKQCVQDCATTSEYNPVCGSDNVTYINPGKFVCARNCGHEVFVARRGRCPNDTPNPRNSLLGQG